jgi:hypothetical protein
LILKFNEIVKSKEESFSKWVKLAVMDFFGVADKLNKEVV